MSKRRTTTTATAGKDDPNGRERMSLRGAAQHIGIAPALRFERIGEIKLRGFSFSTELFAACLAHEEE